MKRTVEEYHAAALLLGTDYWQGYHAFHMLGGDPWLDADTLAPLTPVVMNERLRQFHLESYRLGVLRDVKRDWT